MKILYIGAFRLPNYDAAAARVLNIARALRAAGHDVSFISWGGLQRDDDLLPDGSWSVDGFHYVVTNELPQPGDSFWVRLKNRINRGSETKKILREWPGHIDVIITYDSSLCHWLVPFCEKRGIKLVNDLIEWYSYNEIKPFDWLSYAYEMHFFQKKVKNKIVISSYLDNYYKSTHNIVVPATCDSSEPKWITNIDYADALVPPFRGITLIYAGNPAKKDAVHKVINAVNNLANEGALIRFLILGITKEKYIERYRALLKDENLSNAILFLGSVSQDVIPSFYHHADFMILLRENSRMSNAGFPTKFAESFTSGTPVIANLTSDLGLYLIDKKTGFVVDEPTEAAIYSLLKETVLKLSRNEVDEMKEHVRKESTRLDYHAWINSLGDFFEHLK